MPQNFLSYEDIKLEEKRLYEEYKLKLEELKKVKKERESMGQVFTKGLLPIYVLYIISLSPTNGNEISHKIGNRTNGMWIPSTGGIYPLLKKFEKQKWITGHWDDPEKKFQKIYTLTAEGYNELNNKKEMLQQKMKEALEVFNIIYSDLYKDS